jgi:hypothetical protein
MRYKVNKSKHSREQRVVTEYGELWEREFLRCCQDKSVTNAQTAELFKCDESTIILQKKKRGLLEPAFYDKEMGAEQYYKMKVDKLCEEYDEVTLTLLQKSIPGAYSYLGDHDYDWLRSRIVFWNEQKYIREYEDAILDKLNEIIAKFADDGYPKRQITYGYIAGMVGSTRDKLRSRERFRLLLDNIIESQFDWVRRRAQEICKKRIDSVKATTVKTIRREMNLHKGTYEQYQALLQEVIDAIYGK